MCFLADMSVRSTVCNPPHLCNHSRNNTPTYPTTLNQISRKKKQSRDPAAGHVSPKGRERKDNEAQYSVGLTHGHIQKEDLTIFAALAFSRARKILQVSVW